MAAAAPIRSTESSGGLTDKRAGALGSASAPVVPMANSICRPPNALPFARIPKYAWGPCSPFARSPSPPLTPSASAPDRVLRRPRGRPPAAIRDCSDPLRAGALGAPLRRSRPRPPRRIESCAAPRGRPPAAIRDCSDPLRAGALGAPLRRSRPRPPRRMSLAPPAWSASSGDSRLLRSPARWRARGPSPPLTPLLPSIEESGLRLSRTPVRADHHDGPDGDHR